MKYRWLYLIISGIVIFSGVFSLIKWGLKYGVDFTGGTLIECKFADGRKEIKKYSPMKEADLDKIRLDFHQLTDFID